MSLCSVWFLAVFYYTGQSNAFYILPSCLFRSVSCFCPFNQKQSNFQIWEFTRSFCFLWNSHRQSCGPQEKPDRHLQLSVILITDASMFYFFRSASFSACRCASSDPSASYPALWPGCGLLHRRYSSECFVILRLSSHCGSIWTFLRVCLCLVVGANPVGFMTEEARRSS